MNQQNKPHLSLILLTKNEEENLKKHFDWLDKCSSINEIIAIDDNSNDNTKEIIKSFESNKRKIKIFSRGLDNDFSTQRNFAISKTSNDWILWFDADEKPSNELIGFLNNIDLNQYINIFTFKRIDIFLNKKLKYGETSNIRFTRLFNKNFGTFINQVHEIWQSDESKIDKNLVIYHYSHSNLNNFLQKINFYTDIRSQELYKQKIETNIFQIIFFPLAKFIQNYIFRLGFLDSTLGIIMALSMSLHSFLVRSKLWHLYQK